MPDPSFTVIALAGGTLERDFRKAGYSAANKAYLPIAGTPMLERVLRAFRSSHSVGRIRVVTQPDAFAAAFGSDGAALADDVIAPGSGLIDSMLAGFAGLDEHEMTLVSATDLPLLNAAAIDAFASQARHVQPEYDIGYGFVSRQAHVAKYPQVRHTWVPLREGVFCGGGVSVLRAGAATQAAELLRKVAALRKSPLRLGGRFLCGSAGAFAVRRRAHRRTRTTGRRTERAALSRRALRRAGPRRQRRPARGSQRRRRDLEGDQPCPKHRELSSELSSRR